MMKITKMLAAVIAMTVVCSMCMVTLADETVGETAMPEVPVVLETPSTDAVVPTDGNSFVDNSTPIETVAGEPTASPAAGVTVEPSALPAEDILTEENMIPAEEALFESTAQATAENGMDATVAPTAEVTPTPTDVPDEQVMPEALPTEEPLPDLSGVIIALHYLSGSDVSLGDTVMMSAEITGLDGMAYTIQWQYLTGGVWHDLSGANGNTCQFTLTMDSATYAWRVVLTVG